MEPAGRATHDVGRSPSGGARWNIQSLSSALSPRTLTADEMAYQQLRDKPTGAEGIVHDSDTESLSPEKTRRSARLESASHKRKAVPQVPNTWSTFNSDDGQKRLKHNPPTSHPKDAPRHHSAANGSNDYESTQSSESETDGTPLSRVGNMNHPRVSSTATASSSSMGQIVTIGGKNKPILNRLFALHSRLGDEQNRRSGGGGTAATANDDVKQSHQIVSETEYEGLKETMKDRERTRVLGTSLIAYLREHSELEKMDLELKVRQYEFETLKQKAIADMRTHPDRKIDLSILTDDELQTIGGGGTLQYQSYAQFEPVTKDVLYRAIAIGLSKTFQVESGEALGLVEQWVSDIQQLRKKIERERVVRRYDQHRNPESGYYRYKRLTGNKFVQRVNWDGTESDATDDNSSSPSSRSHSASSDSVSPSPSSPSRGGGRGGRGGRSNGGHANGGGSSKPSRKPESSSASTSTSVSTSVSTSPQQTAHSSSSSSSSTVIPHRHRSQHSPPSAPPPPPPSMRSNNRLPPYLAHRSPSQPSHPQSDANLTHAFAIPPPQLSHPTAQPFSASPDRTAASDLSASALNHI